jgi:hypothetical protein
MSAATCSLAADELAAQLDRYRALGRHAAAVDYEPGRVAVRFADDPPRALIERTLEVERGCCPFLQIEYQPAARSLAISVDRPDRRPSLDVIADALGESRAAELLPESEPGVTSCCSSTALQTCCQPYEKQDCCGQPAGEKKDAATSRCGCNT